MTDMRVALLRGINVGKAKRIAMADLRKLVEALGYSDVRTLLNSGNVVFSVPAKLRGDPAPGIEAAIVKRLGISSKVIVLSAEKVATIVRQNPLADVADNPSRLFVMVLAKSFAMGGFKPLENRRYEPEILAVRGRAAFIWCPNGVTKSRLIAAVNGLVGDKGTVRNIATMTKLRVMMAGS